MIRVHLFGASGSGVTTTATALAPCKDWVLAGSLDSWGLDIAPLIALAVFLYVPQATRLARMRARELQLFGEPVAPGGDDQQRSQRFLSWAAHYDVGDLPGRSKPRHEAWMQTLPCPVLRIEGEFSTAEAVDRICAALGELLPSAD
jgi:hypothetical protein